MSLILYTCYSNLMLSQEVNPVINAYMQCAWIVVEPASRAGLGSDNDV
jgi:hypothetical protein